MIDVHSEVFSVLRAATPVVLTFCLVFVSMLVSCMSYDVVYVTIHIAQSLCISSTYSMLTLYSRNYVYFTSAYDRK